MKVYFQQLDHAQGLPLPEYKTKDSAGCDLRAAVSEAITLEPGKRALIPTGLRMALPEGYEAQIRPRSGLAYRNGITMLNTPGTIDSDYRGEIKVLAINHGEEAFIINHGDRIAQMVVSPILQIEIQQVYELPKTKRGDGGFGSTGVR
ncbi:MAG: dUTP diphosphatase [Balneolaceae bacterium]|nr:dUTP diphosphatase [Balneolaceae bacterium]